MIIKLNLDRFIQWQLTDDVSMEHLKKIVEDSWRELTFPLHQRIQDAADYFAEFGYIPKEIVDNLEELNLKTEEEDEIHAVDIEDLYNITIKWT